MRSVGAEHKHAQNVCQQRKDFNNLLEGHSELAHSILMRQARLQCLSVPFSGCNAEWQYESPSMAFLQLTSGLENKISSVSVLLVGSLMLVLYFWQCHSFIADYFCLQEHEDFST